MLKDAGPQMHRRPRKGTASTLESWMAGPMAFDWEDLSEAECDRNIDRALHANAIEFHRGFPPNTIPPSIRKALDNVPR